MLTPKQKLEQQIKNERAAARIRDLIGCDPLPPKVRGLCSAQRHMMVGEQAIARSKALDNLLTEKADALLQEFRDKISGDVT